MNSANVLGGKSFVVRQEEDRRVGEPGDGLHLLVVVDRHQLGEQDRGEPVGRDVADHQRVAVGPRAGHGLDRDDAGGARLVLDDPCCPRSLRNCSA